MISIDAIHREIWSELVRMLRDKAPAWAVENNMTVPDYLKDQHGKGRFGAGVKREYESGEKLSKSCEFYDTIMEQQILEDAIVPTDQDAHEIYREAHRIDCEGASTGYQLKLQVILWYVLGRWPELTDSLVQNGRLPDVPPFEQDAKQETLNQGKADLKKVKPQTKRKGEVKPQIEKQPDPSDLMTLEVVVSKYNVSRSTLKRAIGDGRLKSYRPENSATNSKHTVSEATVSKFWSKL